MLNWQRRPEHVPVMAQEEEYQNHNEVLIKFLAPARLKQAWSKLANECNLELSAMLRLIASEYVKRSN
jgi:hypothetical protein